MREASAIRVRIREALYDPMCLAKEALQLGRPSMSSVSGLVYVCDMLDEWLCRALRGKIEMLVRRQQSNEHALESDNRGRKAVC